LFLCVYALLSYPMTNPRITCLPGRSALLPIPPSNYSVLNVQHLWVEGENHLFGQGMTPPTWMDIPAIFNSTIYSSPRLCQCRTNTDDRHKTIPLYPTRLNSDDHEPPLHHIALRRWTFHSTLSTPTLWSRVASITGHLKPHNCCRVTSTLSFIGPGSAYHLSLRTLSHRQCPSSSFDHEGCTPSSHRFIPSPLTVLSWGIAALTSGWMQNSERVRFGKVQMKGYMRRSSTGERFYVWIKIA